jgi:hypothetical protein
VQLAGWIGGPVNTYQMQDTSGFIVRPGQNASIARTAARNAERRWTSAGYRYRSPPCIPRGDGALRPTGGASGV